MSKDLLIKIIEIILPSVIAVLTVFLTNYFNTVSTKRKALQHRVNAVYKPFYLAYFKYCTNLSIWDEIDYINDISKMKNICLENIDCLETNTQEILINLARKLSLWSPGDNTADIDKVFQSLVGNMFKEYKSICYKLKLPKPVSSD